MGGVEGAIQENYRKIHPEFSEKLVDVEEWRRHFKQREES